MDNCIALRISLSVMAILPTVNVYPWWDQSHQLIGYIAGQTVSELTKTKAEKLLFEPIHFPGDVNLSSNTSGFDTAASWPDAIKEISNQPTKLDHRQCHFLDLMIEKSFVGTDINDTTAQNALKTALATRTVNSISCLKSAIKSLVDPTQTAYQQAIALRFVMHIVGDMTQPLHNASLVDNDFHDEGGNKTRFSTKVYIPTTNGINSPQSTLHALWDATLGKFLQFPFNRENSKTGLFAKSDITLNIKFAQTLQSQTKIQEIFRAMMESNQSIEDWVIDGYRIAGKYVYSDLSESWGTYSVYRYDIINEQVAKGAYRLALLLDAIFDPANSTFGFQKVVYDIKNNRAIKPFDLN